MKRVFSFVVAVIVGMHALLAQVKDPKAGKVLNKMSEKYRNMSGFRANFTYELVNKAYKMNEKSQGEITVKGSNFRLKIGGQEIINNGSTVWTFFKDANEVNIADYNPDPDAITPDKIYTMYKKGYKYLLLAEQDVEGVPVEIIDLEPEDRHNKINKIRLIIGKNDSYIKSWKIFENTGTVYTYRITNFTPNVPIEKDYFSFDKSKYPGVEVNDLRY